MSIAERLVKARGDKSRDFVSKTIGISISAISMYETGMRVPRDEIKVKLANLYGVSVQDLFYPDNATNCGNNEERRNQLG